MVGWTTTQGPAGGGSKPPQSTPVPTSISNPIIEPHVDPPKVGTWVYVSRRLDVFELPATAMLGPVVAFGTVPHYRLTPNTFAWFQAAGLALATAVESDPAKAADYREYTKVMQRLSAYACEHWTEIEMASAKAELPEIPWSPIT